MVLLNFFKLFKKKKKKERKRKEKKKEEKILGIDMLIEKQKV